METNRKIIITLKEDILNGNGTSNKIYCDSVVSDQMIQSHVVAYVIDDVWLYLPIHNFLGSHLNENFKPDPDGN